MLIGSHGGSVRRHDRLENVDHLETSQENGRELFLSVIYLFVQQFSLHSLLSLRLVFLSRQTRKTRKFEVSALAAAGGRDPDFTYKQPSENKGGVSETFIRVSCTHS